MIKFTSLGAIHEEKPQGFRLGSIQAPVQIPSTYLMDPSGSFFSLSALMQYTTPKCGGYSLGQAINFAKVLQGASSEQLSGNFDYAYEKTVDGLPTVDGTLISAIGKAGSNVGSCKSSLFPQDTEQIRDTTLFSQASAEALTDGASRLLGTPFLLDDLSIGGIHQACFQNGFVILEVQVGEEWWTTLNGNDSWSPTDLLPIRPPVKVVDSHFILVAPYDEPNNQTWFINSWSQKWGQNGFGYFGSNYEPYIKNGIAFKKIPASVHQALTSNQADLAKLILADMAEVLALIQKEI